MSLLSALLASAVVLLLCASSAVAQLDVSLTLASDYTSTIRVNGAVWLQSNPVWFTAEGKTYSAADKTLTLGSVETTIGADALGMWNATVISWTAADNPALRWMTLYRSYLHPNNPMAIRAIAFDQVWVSGANNTRASDYNNVLSGFPSFNPKDTKPSLGALQLAGDFDANRQFLWSGSNATLDLIWGAASGPLTLFEEKGRVAVTISPFSSFMAASLANKGGMAVWGVMGSMTSVPAGWSMSTIAVFGQEGITNNVLAWGDVLLTQYGKNRASMYDEFTTQYLGYATGTPHCTVDINRHLLNTPARACSSLNSSSSTLLSPSVRQITVRTTTSAAAATHTQIAHVPLSPLLPTHRLPFPCLPLLAVSH